MHKIITVTLLLFALLAFPASSQQCGEEITEIIFFYSSTCPHCSEQKPLMRAISDNNQDVHVHFYNVAEENDRWKHKCAEYNVTPAGVPMTFIGDKVFMGYTKESGELEYNPITGTYIGYKNQIIAQAEASAGHEIDLGEIKKETQASKGYGWMVFLILLAYLIAYPLISSKLNTAQAKRFYWAGSIALAIICLFIYLAITPETAIKDFAQNMPFPLFVFVIALADGFNPCAFTVLVILLSLLTYTKSKKNMVIIGTTFIITSAVMYFIFIMIMVLLGSYFINQYGEYFMWALGIIIIVAGAINIKDFFFFNKGVSLTLSQKHKEKITKKAGKIVQDLKKGSANKKLFFTALGGTVILAIFVNIVELGCTAILPSVYMTSLIKTFGENIGMLHILWTLFYSFIYIIPLFAILFTFIYSFKSARITERQGRILKLVGGLFMLLLGLLMIFNPGLLALG